MIKVGTIYLTIINKIVHQFARQKKNSEWIYSSLSQKMAHSKLPTISIFAQPPHSTLNLTLRIKKVLQNSHLLLSYNPLQTHKFLNNKESESENKVNGEQTSNIIISQNNRSELAKWQNKGVEVEWSLELSKQLQLAIENQKIVQSNNDRQNRSLKKQQDELLSYIEMNDFKSKLQSFKNKHGFPQIGSLTEQLQNIAEWRKAGIAITCVIDQLTPRVSKQLFKYLQQQELPYEILPTYNQLVNMLAASGFPADRFSIQYFPKSFAQAFALRRPMKMTVALLINSKNLAQCISAIKQVYGKNQKIYLQNEEGTVLFRGEVDQFQLQNRPEGIIRLAISPYLSNFNEELKEQKSKISRLYGESMHENTHFVRMEFIAQQLEYLRKRKQKKEVVLQSMIKELIAKIQNDQKVVSIVATLTKVTLNQAKFLVQKAKQRTVQDYIGLQKFVKKN